MDLFLVLLVSFSKNPCFILDRNHFLSYRLENMLLNLLLFHFKLEIKCKLHQILLRTNPLSLISEILTTIKENLLWVIDCRVRSIRVNIKRTKDSNKWSFIGFKPSEAFIESAMEMFYHILLVFYSIICFFSSNKLFLKSSF